MLHTHENVHYSTKQNIPLYQIQTYNFTGHRTYECTNTNIVRTTRQTIQTPIIWNI